MDLPLSVPFTLESIALISTCRYSPNHYDETSSPLINEFTIRGITSSLFWDNINDIFVSLALKDNLIEVVRGYLFSHIFKHKHFEKRVTDIDDMNKLMDLSESQLEEVHKGLNDDLPVSCYIDTDNTAETMSMTRKELQIKKVEDMINDCEQQVVD